ncbi:hypothetical protein J6590_008788 [Homalodisca vitripennis]|nr:hypothetical protein J6590_008788 [Homalodisca vitripennis]
MVELVTFSLLCVLLYYRVTRGDDCITTQTDSGAVYIKELEEAIDAASCSLVHAVTYSDYDVIDEEEFDFIVVGAGSAGCVVANRLSENPDWRVLLLEAGGDPDITSEIPGFNGAALNTNLDWHFPTEPQPTNCLGMVNKSCTLAAGKTIGGSSSIGGMLYIRGNPRDYNHWDNLGNYGWNYRNMLHYFKKSEDLRSVEVLTNEDARVFHGRGGYLKIESYRNDIEFYKHLLSRSFSEIGLQSFTDVNADNYRGFFTLQGTLNNSRRCSAAKAFIHNFQSRSNLKISKNSIVIKVLIDENKTARGVIFTKRGRYFIAKATKEVILSAGAVNSPKLLMLSGVGPRKHLEDLGINVIADLNVGYNFQDQLLMRGYVVSFDIEVPPRDPVDETFQFLIHGRGNLAGIGVLTVIGYIKTIQAAYPNIQFYFLYFAKNSTDSIRTSFTLLKFNDDVTRAILDINYRKYTMLIVPFLLRPKSRGRVLLRSADPMEYPKIYPGYLTEDSDVTDLLESIKFMDILTQTRDMRRFGAKLEKIDLPACNNFPFRSELYWRCIIPQLSTPAFHQAGTCHMGPTKNDGSVVDPFLRVHDITGLRVVDASIMPTITSGSINAPVIAIAEKASDIIKQYWA